MISVRDIALMIDYSLLRPNLTQTDFEERLAIAKEYGVTSVCVPPCELSFASGYLSDASVKVGTVIGFPHGSNTTFTKLSELTSAMADGAQELAVVLNIGRLLSGDYCYVRDELGVLVSMARTEQALVKVVFETCYLTKELIKKACELSEDVGADFVETSTGFSSGGATVEDVVLMRSCCSSKIQVKASGSICTLDAVLAFRKAGCSRFGTTAAKAILDECNKRVAEKTLQV
jgi:deoxyribose-phosphate aldolase